MVKEEKPLLNLKQKLKSSIQSVNRAMRKKGNKMLGLLRWIEKSRQFWVENGKALNSAMGTPRSCKSDLNPS